MIRFTENLDILLQDNNMTKSELAEKIGVNKSTVTSWYNKSCDGVHLKTLIAISDLFGVTLDELAKGELEPAAKPDTFTADEMAKLKKLISHADEILKEG